MIREPRIIIGSNRGVNRILRKGGIAGVETSLQTNQGHLQDLEVMGDWVAYESGA